MNNLKNEVLYKKITMPDMFIISGICFFITNGRAFMTFDIHEKNRDKKVNSMIYKKIETFSVMNL